MLSRIGQKATQMMKNARFLSGEQKHFATGLKCVVCAKEYGINEAEYTCPDHEDDGNLDVTYDYKAMREYIDENGLSNEPGLWRYKAMMPVNIDAKIPNVYVGNTPLMKLDDMAERFGVKEFYIKDDGRNPTGSLKDRASALLATKAKDEDRGIVATASTGNAGAALAGICASLHHPCVIFVPAAAPIAKITQLLVFGSNVVLVDGKYDDAFDMCMDATQAFGWWCRNTGYNPYTSEGKKTVSFEMCEQLAAHQGIKSVNGEPVFSAPDYMFVSVGDGNIISGVHKGLKDLFELGYLDRIPKLMGVSATGSNAISAAWMKGMDPIDITPIETTTLADSISAGLPRDRIRAYRAVSETEGKFYEVTDEQILAAIKDQSTSTGIFPEPAAAAAYAGFLKSMETGDIPSDASVMILSTGTGLKDIANAQKCIPEALVVPNPNKVEGGRTEEWVKEQLKHLADL